jgi:hypothetical protein
MTRIPEILLALVVHDRAGIRGALRPSLALADPDRRRAGAHHPRRAGDPRGELIRTALGEAVARMPDLAGELARRLVSVSKRWLGTAADRFLRLLDYLQGLEESDPRWRHYFRLRRWLDETEPVLKRLQDSGDQTAVKEARDFARDVLESANEDEIKEEAERTSQESLLARLVPFVVPLTMAALGPLVQQALKP